MRRLPTAAALVLATAATPALVILPTVTRPVPAPRAVAPRTVALPVHGVDARALAALPRERARVAAGRLQQVAARLRDEVATDVAEGGPAAPVVLTRELTPAATGTPRFDLVAVSWDRSTPSGSSTRSTASAGAAAEPEVQVRVREAGGWTGWQPLHHGDDGPDGGPAGAAELARGQHASAPLLTNGADAVQVRVHTEDGRTPPGLRVDLVDGGRSGSDAPAVPADSAMAATPVPPVVTRREWGADERLVQGTPSVNPAVRALLVHHTDTTNSYTRAQAYAQIRAIYAFHTKVRGWNDIGYNLLVDRFGQVFEGRRGSLTAAVTGAHAGGFNSQSLGIAVLGAYGGQAPPPATLRALGGVIAWKAAQHEINPLGTARLVSAGGPFTRYPAGSPVRVAALASHRDVGMTECPGDGLWDQLPRLRRDAAARMRPGLVAPGVSAAAVTSGAGGVTVTGAVPTTQRWTLTATPRCSASPVRTLSGRATGRITARWDLRSDAGTPAPPGIYRLALATRSPVGAAPTWTTDVEVLPATTGAASRCPVRRVVQPDAAGPVERAVAVGRVVAPDAATVVLAGISAAGTDGVVAAPLARALGAPLLFTDAAALSPSVAAELRRRRATRVVVVGGLVPVTPAVVTQLRDLGVTTVQRIGGRNPHVTAANVARAYAALPRPAGTPAPTSVIVAPLQGGTLAHAAVVGGVGAATNRPVLFVTPRGFTVETAAAVRALRPASATVIGGTDVFSDRAARGFATLGVPRWTRVVAGGRAGLALTLARSLPPDATGTPAAARTAWAAAATDAAVPDVAAAGASGRPVLLLPAVVSTGIESWFATRRPATTWVLGGTAQVPVPLFSTLTEVAR